MFASKNGTPLVERNLTRRILKPVGVRLGMPWLSWHVFRRSHSTFGEQIGVALSDRQAQMGHADVGMTLHYTHSDLERRRAAIEAIATRLVGKEEDTEKRADSDSERHEGTRTPGVYVIEEIGRAAGT
ncbi:MAG: tyrosine-type recombinase/integrase [Bryobacteraceae bacterium]